MGANGFDLIMSNNEVDAREDNLLANRGCKIQKAQTTTPLLRDVNHKAEIDPLVNRTGSQRKPLQKCRGFPLNKPLDIMHTYCIIGE